MTPLYGVTDQRDKEALRLRRTGLSWKDVGAQLNISGSHAASRARRVEWREKHGYADRELHPWAAGLPTGVANCLIHAGCNNRTDVERALVSGTRIDGVGKRGRELIATWLGLPRPPTNPIAIASAITLLKRAGYSVSRTGDVP